MVRGWGLEANSYLVSFLAWGEQQGSESYFALGSSFQVQFNYTWPGDEVCRWLHTHPLISTHLCTLESLEASSDSKSWSVTASSLLSHTPRFSASTTFPEALGSSYLFSPFLVRASTGAYLSHTLFSQAAVICLWRNRVKWCCRARARGWEAE